MVKPYEQDVILDVAGQPIYDVMTIVQRRIDQFSKTLREMGKDTVGTVEQIKIITDANIKALRQARSDLKVLQQETKDKTGRDNKIIKELSKERDTRIKAHNDATSAAEKSYRDEVSAYKAANRDKLIESKVFYGQEERNRKEARDRELADADRSRQGVANANKKLLEQDKQNDRERIASTKEIRKAQLETRTATARSGAKTITDPNYARQLKLDSDARLTQLRQQREAAAYNDAAAARGLAERIVMEKAFGAELTSTISKLETQKRLADNKFTMANQKSEKLLVSSDVAERAGLIGTDTALRRYREERAALELQLRRKTLTAEERIETNRLLEIAKSQVREAQKLLNEETKQTKEKQKQVAEAARLEAAAAKANAQKPSALSNILSPGYALNAVARTGVYGAAAGAAYGTFNAVTSSVGEVVKMEDELAKLQAISNSTDGEISKLRTSIFEIGSTSRYATNDLIKISQTLAQAGVSASEMTSVLQSVTTLATASGSTPDEAVQLVTAALGSFQLQASEATRISDLMTEALNRTKLTVGQVGQAIQYVGATAYEQNISLETLLATVGAVAQGGVRSGSTIGTGFRQFLVDLQTPSEKLTFELDRLGITQDEISVKTRGLAAVLDTLKTKGFGASQAYEGLETRAAAFYLVAKNNTDIMGDLQLSFAQQGAAAIANERAMDTLTAQWQRFKNVISQDFSNDLEGLLIITKNLLGDLADAYSWIDRIRKTGPDKGLVSEEDGRKIFADVFNTLMPNFNPDPNSRGVGDWLMSLDDGLKAATASTVLYGEEMNEADQKVSQHSNTIIALDKEMERLRLQQSSLIGNSKAVSVETVTLSSRFEGLTGYLGKLQNGYNDLINAMGLYRAEENRLLGQSYGGLVGAQQKQNLTDRGQLNSKIGQIRSNPTLMGKMTAQERALLDKPDDLKFPLAMADAARRVEKSNGNLAQVLNEASIIAGRLAIGVPAVDRNRRLGGIATTAGTTQIGRQTTANLDVYTARIAGMSNKTSAERTQEGADISSRINNNLNQLQGILPKVKDNKAYTDFLNQSITMLKELLTQVGAAIKPTKDELEAAKSASAEAKKVEREANKRPLVTQADLDSIIKSVAGEGIRLGSGARTPAEQEGLFAKGVTKARGVGDRVSDHVGSAARDIPTRGWTEDRIQRTAAALRTQLAASGIEAQVIVERGGKNNGTGPHIHTGVRKGARLGRDRSEQSEDRYEASRREAQVALDEQDLKTQLEALARATTKSSFDNAAANARTALDRVNAGLMKSAQQELAVNGFVEGSPEFENRMLQTQQAIEQNWADYQQNIADSIIKSTEGQLKAAQTAFDKAIQPAQAALQIAQSQAEGLNAYSIRNNVPDYVRTLADNRTAAAQERVQRAQYAAMPSYIAAQQSAISGATAAAQEKGVTAETTAKIAEMNVELERLKANRDALAASLGADALIPQSLGEGLRQAVEAYRQVNNLTNTFAQDLTMNLGGALETVHGGLTDMFSSILDGSQSALGAFGNFAKGIMSWLTQMAAKALATQIFGLLLNAVGMGVGATGGWGGSGATADLAPVGTYTSFKGGLLDSSSPYSSEVKAYNSGGAVNNGDSQRDSVRAKLAKGEWVVQKKSVDSVGNQFMAQLNQHGSKALDSLGSVPSIDMKNHTETNVYVVPPEQKPSMGPNDVLVLMQEDMLNGQTKRLIQHIAREG